MLIETLSFYANLRLPKEFSSRQKRRTVNRVIDLLGLYGTLNLFELTFRLETNFNR